MIEAHDLSRRYGDFTAVRGVSFAVDEGEIVGMLGPNGAGKTTTIRMITGFLPPTGGRVTVAGKDLFEEPRKARRDVGYLPEHVALYPEMRVEEYLSYRARLEGMSRSEEIRALGDTLDRCLLTDVRRQIIGTLSKGYRQRVGLATAILHRPKVLVLDEPTVGLDPGQIIAIRHLIRELGRERTLLLSTHILPEVELLCDRILIIDRGRLVAQGTPAELHRHWLEHRVVRVAFEGHPREAREVLETLPGVRSVRAGVTESLWVLECEGDSDPRPDVFRAAVERGWTLLTLAAEDPTLEEIFVRLTTRDEAELDAGEPVAVVPSEPLAHQEPEESEEVPS